MKRVILLSCLALGLSVAAARAQQADLKDGDCVAVIGDSITEQKVYSLFIEDYLLMCRPAADLRVTQMGWSGETAPGFLARMANDCLPFHPVVATTSFGMNDGGYSPETPDKAKKYHDSQTAIVQELKKAGVRLIVVGSPGVVDADSFHNPQQATMYNQTLAAERDIAKAVAQEQGVVFADVYDPMLEVMTKAKAKYGHDYYLAGKEGVHPDRNGHLVMAYAFLKALGCDGKIGVITVNLAGDTATATTGHKVLACAHGQVDIESSRYPFCFYGEAAQTGSTRGVLEWLPFNDQLNRFMLVVKGAPRGKYKVTWGKDSKEFTAAELAKGINLAAEFLDNPFSAPFQDVEQAIVQQQNAETGLIKNDLYNLTKQAGAASTDTEALVRAAAALVEKDHVLRVQSATAVKPVRHTIKIEVIP